MEERHTDIEKRVEAIERLLRDAKITLAIVGACLVAFLGYQSFLGIPRAIVAGLQADAIIKLRKQATEAVNSIEDSASKAREAAKSSKDYESQVKKAAEAWESAVLERQQAEKRQSLNRVLVGKLRLNGKCFGPAYFATCTNKKGDSVGSFYENGICPDKYSYTSQRRVLVLKETTCN